MERRFDVDMSEYERVKISSFIENNFGIKMPPSKKVLLTSRLSKRLSELGIPDYGKYYSYLTSKKGLNTELYIFADLVSTHETRFFREAGHFDFLLNHALFSVYKKKRSVISDSIIRILSSPCSTGEEVYSIACTVEKFKELYNIPSLKYQITGVDISDGVVKKAERGVFAGDIMGNVSEEYKHKYFYISKNKSPVLFKAAPELIRNTNFRLMNLMNTPYHFEYLFDIIFCRNMLIYFSKQNQERICRSLCSCLTDSGFLFIGHSESLLDFKLPLHTVSSAVYKKI